MFIQVVCKTLRIRNHFNTDYNPNVNGQTECFNRTIDSALRSYVVDHQEDWAFTHIQCLMRTSRKSTLQGT
eukprot:IDg12501t1